MPKKTRKMKQRAAERRSIQQQTTASESPIVTSTAPMASGTPTRMMRSETNASRVMNPLTFDYSYIYGDLKRIALFAAMFFVILIALSFVIK
jgi:hypothetical protein